MMGVLWKQRLSFKSDKHVSLPQTERKHHYLVLIVAFCFSLTIKVDVFTTVCLYTVQTARKYIGTPPKLNEFNFQNLIRYVVNWWNCFQTEPDVFRMMTFPTLGNLPFLYFRSLPYWEKTFQKIIAVRNVTKANVC